MILIPILSGISEASRTVAEVLEVAVDLEETADKVAAEGVDM